MVYFTHSNYIAGNMGFETSDTSNSNSKMSQPVIGQTAINAKNYRHWGQKQVNPFFRFGLPLISLTILGALGLAHLQQGRKDMEKVRDDKEWEALERSKALSREGPLGKFMKLEKKPPSLEEELKALQQKIDIKNFEYKKIPRPSESN